MKLSALCYDLSDRRSLPEIGLAPIPSSCFSTSLFYLTFLSVLLNVCQLNEFYGFLPALTIECLYVREEILGTPKNNDSKGIKGNGNGQDPSAAPPKSIYFIPLSIRKVMEGDTAGLLKIVSAGVKVFERSAGGGRSGLGTCEYRLLQVHPSA